MNEKQIYKFSKDLFDGCALCGNPEVAMHHIVGGYGGRKTEIGNVIPLCPTHHAMVHSNLKVYRPMLQELMKRRLEIEGIEINHPSEPKN